MGNAGDGEAATDGSALAVAAGTREAVGDGAGAEGEGVAAPLHAATTNEAARRAASRRRRGMVGDAGSGRGDTSGSGIWGGSEGRGHTKPLASDEGGVDQPNGRIVACPFSRR